MLKVCHTQGDDELARVFVGELEDGSHIEFVESVQPPKTRKEKWVLIVSTLKGCPVGCKMCDAGGHYKGKLGCEEILGQIDHMVYRRYPDGVVDSEKLKIQFARMGDPAFNNGVLEALELLPGRYRGAPLFPSISTIAPAGCLGWLEKLAGIKNEHYSDGRFQMQFSLHTTDEEARRDIVPIKTLSFADMALWGRNFRKAGDQKITLNFAAPEGYPLDPEKLLEYFSPADFIIKLTPINPTSARDSSGLSGRIKPDDERSQKEAVERFGRAGYDTILSIGEVRENAIGSNCGMYVNQVEGEKPESRSKPAAS